MILYQFVSNKYQMISKPQVQRNTQRFFQIVQAGDLALFDNFQEAFALFGYTKAGKTTSSHYLCNNILKAFQKDGMLQYKLANPRDNSPIIGYQLHSQTQIPNIFEARFRDRKGAIKTIHLLDQPGYGDTYGFHRILSNGYFHYRTFSKTPKLKFILAVKKSELTGTGFQFTRTIKLFIDSFARYNQIKRDILKATVLLITQANPQENIEQVKRLVIRLRVLTANMTETESQNYLQFIDHITQENKLFVIQKPQNHNSQTRQTNLLRSMDQCTSFWERQVENNIVDMSPINFSVANYILGQLSLGNNNHKFTQDFQFFIGYMNRRINTFLYQHQCSFRKIIKLIIAEAANNDNSHGFLQAMNRFNLLYYKFEEGPQWRAKREKAQVNLFRQADTDMRLTYFIRKFKFIEHFKRQVQIFYQLFDERHNFSRSVKQLQSFSQIFRSISKKLNILRVYQNDSSKIIYKYGYLIQRLIEQCKIISVVLYSRPKIAEQFGQRNLIVDFLRPIFDQAFRQEVQENLQTLKLKSINNINGLQPSQEIINFMEELLEFDQTIILKIAQITIKYAKSKENNASRQQKRYIIQKTLHYRNVCYDYYRNTPQKQKQCTESIFKLTSILGNLLLGFQQFELAREVFKSINNASSVLNIYELELKTMTDKQKIKELFKLYGRHAEEYKRRELALRCFQQVHDICFQQVHDRCEAYDQLVEISKKIVSLGIANTTPVGVGGNYLELLVNGLYFHDIPDSIKTKISEVKGKSDIKKN